MWFLIEICPKCSGNGLCIGGGIDLTPANSSRGIGRVESKVTYRSVSKKTVVDPKPVSDSTPLKNFMVVIDPGHGGKDPGATGRKNIHEKNIVLKISRLIASDINKRAGLVLA